MAKDYNKFYTRLFETEKPKPRYFNRGFSGTFGSEGELPNELQEARLDKRAADYERWRRNKVKVSKAQLKEETDGQIGSVSSSWLTSLGYNPDTSEAVATFYGTNQLFFYKMSYKKYLEWLNSPSKGKWLHDHKSIMQNYRTEGSGGKPMEKQLKRKAKNYLKKWR